VMLCKLTDIAPLVADRVRLFEGTNEYVATGSLDNFENIISENVTYANRPSRADLTVKKNDLCFARMQNTEKVLLITDANKNFIYSTGFAVIRPNIKNVFPRFLFHLIKSKTFQQKKDLLCSGATQKAITNEKINSIEIYLPTLLEQERIATILDKTELVKGKCELALKNIESQEQSIFAELFGDGQSILKNWPNKPLGDLLDFMTSGSRGWAAYYADHGEKFLRIQNVANNQLNLEDVVFVSPPESAEANRTSVKAGDVLISITADLGRTAVIPDSLGKAYINQHLAILRTSKISSVFLSGFLSSSCGKIQIQKKNRGGVKAGLNFNDIRSLVIPMPDNNLIVKYENYLSKIRLLKKLMTESLYKSCELIEVIQHQQFAKHLS